MESTNTRYVRRSSSLLNYGPQFSYQESWSHSSFLRAFAYTFGLLVLMFSLLFPPVRWLVSYLMPSGTGPSLEAREKGFVFIQVFGESEVNNVFL